MPQFNHSCQNRGQAACRWILASDLLLLIKDPPDRVSQWYSGRSKIIRIGPLIIVFFSFFTEKASSPGLPVFPVNVGFFLEWRTP